MISEDSKRILVVEDDPDINRMVSYILRKAGMAVESVFNGTHAQQVLEMNHYDVVVLDIMLPEIDGYALCKMIKDPARDHHTFVVVMSARAYSEDKLYAHLLGADYYLTKPFNPAVLTRVVQELVALKDKEYTVRAQI